ncbi:helix-turn-helix domain-containing protein [Burkholderia pseudomultivorans]|uniref:XRE family transcriptional regulator n=1 Tax=Burkholderia pseudomultivorans TaxID=1207504 RepID=A0A132ENC6_9BURK|nr:helix-turn-helix transcriptional regulator [Burkholderia pseudomultivorans]KWF37407.1 XRE family transcriptional regulator [Burkholderia pseudomultivorans]
MENSKQGRTPFGERLLRARRKRGLSQKQVEMHVGIAQSNLAELELKGTGSGFTVALALLYGVNPVWLALGKGPMTGTMPAPEWLEPLTSDELEIVRKFVDDLIAARETKADPHTAGDDPALKAPESRGGPKKAK